MNNISIEDMIEELEEFYETAGFANYYERELKGKTDEQIRKMYENHIKSLEKIEEEYQKEKEEYLANKENDN